MAVATVSDHREPPAPVPAIFRHHLHAGKRQSRRPLPTFAASVAHHLHQPPLPFPRAPTCNIAATATHQRPSSSAASIFSAQPRARTRNAHCRSEPCSAIFFLAHNHNSAPSFPHHCTTMATAASPPSSNRNRVGRARRSSTTPVAAPSRGREKSVRVKP